MKFSFSVAMTQGEIIERSYPDTILLVQFTAKCHFISFISFTKCQAKQDPEQVLTDNKHSTTNVVHWFPIFYATIAIRFILKQLDFLFSISSHRCWLGLLSHLLYHAIEIQCCQREILVKYFFKQCL